MIKSENNKTWLTVQIVLIILISVSPVISQSVKIAITVALVLLNLFTHARNLYVEKSFLILEALLILSALIDIVHTKNGQPYSMVNIMYPAYFACGYFVVQNYDSEDFLLQYERVLFGFAILSLLGMSVYYINPSLIYSFPTYVQNDATHHTLYFFNYLFSDGWMAVRNTGVAWEPGLFQLLLNIALQFAIRKYDGNKRLIRVIIYLVAIVLTRSTIGYVIMIVNIFSLIKERKLYLFLFVISIVALGASIHEEVAFQLQNKLIGSVAFAARYEPLVNAIKISWNRLFGLGSTGYDELLKSMKIGSFDSYTQILMRYGYPVLVCIISRIINLWKKQERGIAIIIALGFLSEPIWGCSLIAAFLFLRTVNVNNKKHA